MAVTPALSYKTELSDRTLWYDGTSSFRAEDVVARLGKYSVKYVDTLTPQIIQYNRSVASEDKLKIKLAIEPLDTGWNIPRLYKEMDLVDYFSTIHAILVEGKDETEIQQREIRLVQEIKKYAQLGMNDVLRTVIWIITELTKRQVVWGIGRGSSTASYLLYLIGVHDVDSFAYGLAMDDFLR